MWKWLVAVVCVLAVALLSADPGQANSKDGPRRWKRVIKGNSDIHRTTSAG